jgi:uncharacterized protein YjdB
MRIKRSLKVVALVLATLLFFPSAALAALPNNTIIFGTKAYDLSLLNDASLANEILAAFVANDNSFAYKMPAGNFIDPNAQAVDPTTLPAVAYVDAAKVSTNYQAGDGDVVPTAVTLTGVTATMSVQAGQTQQITATPSPADAIVTYTSSDLSKATVSATGLVTGVAVGTANITVTAAKTGMASGTATVAVTVTAIPVVTLTATPATTSVQVGQTQQITAAAVPADATVTYMSSDEAKATVSATGLVTGVAVGTANITVTAAKTGYTSATPATVAVTVTADTTAPAIASVTALDSRTMLVTFSEAMNKASVEDVTNYSLYSVTASGLVPLGAGAAVANTLVHATAAQQTDTKQVKITFDATGSTGYVVGGFANTDYYLYVNDNVAVGTVAADANGNTIAVNSNKQFIGTTAALAAGPALKSASFEKSNYTFTVTFDTEINAVDANVDETKFTLTDGTTSVAMVEANYAAGATDVITFGAFTADQTAAMDLLNDSNLTVTVSAGAVKGNVSGVANAAGSVAATGVTRPVQTAAEYNDLTNRLTLTFSDTMDVAKFVTALGVNKLAFEATAGAFTNFTGSVITPANSNQIVIVADQATARAIEAVTLTAPKIRVTNDGTQNLGLITDMENTATTPVQMREKDYAGIFTITSTAPAISSATYTEATDKLALTFNGQMRSSVSDSTEFHVYVNAVDQGTINASAAAIVADEATDATTVTFDLTTCLGATAALTTEIETAGVIAGTAKLYVTIDTTGLAEQGGQDYPIAVANKQLVTYVPTDVTLTQTNVTESSRYVMVTFNDVVQSTEAQTASNYTIYLVSDPSTTIGFDSAQLLSDVKHVYLHSVTPLNLGNGAYKLGVKNVKPTTGAAMNQTAATAVATNSTVQAMVGPFIDVALNGAANAVNATLTDGGTTGLSAGDYFTLTFNKPVSVKTANLDAADFTVSDSKTLGTGFTAVAGTYPNQIKVTLGTGVDIVPGTTTVVLAAANNAIVGPDGTTVGIQGNQDTVKLTAPVAAPTVASAVFNDTNNSGTRNAGDQLVITLTTEARYAAGKTAADSVSDFVYSAIGGAAGTAFTATAASVSGTTVTLTLDTPTAAAIVPGTSTIDFAADNDALVNTWNIAAVEQALDKTIAKGDTVNPTVTAIGYKASTNTLKFTFSEPVNVGESDPEELAAALAARLTVSAGSSLGASFAAAVLSIDKLSVTITLDGDEAIDQFTTITIDAGVFGDASNYLQDASGNKATRGQGTAYSVTIILP